MKIFLILGVINGFLAVALGAFGAHGLEGKISEKMLDTWDKAVHYQMYHTMALFITGLLAGKITGGSILWAGWLFFIGIIIFYGSLDVYATTGIKSLALMM